MSPKRALVLAAMAAASSVAFASAGPLAAPAAAGGCLPAGAHLLGHGGLVEVYTTEPLASPQAGPVQACLSGRQGHMTLLRGGGRGVSFKVVASSGPLVAYLLTRFGVDSGSTVLRVSDVSAKRVLRELTIGNYVDGGILEREAPTKVVLGPEGAVGWIAASHGPDKKVTYTVRTAATIGPVEKLDEGPDIAPGRLTLSGRRIGWWHAGTELNASLA